MARYVDCSSQRSDEDLKDSQVEGQAQGEPEVLSKFVKDLDKGPQHAHVVRLDTKDMDPVADEDGFETKATRRSDNAAENSVWD
jgi:Acylphosphatase